VQAHIPSGSLVIFDLMAAMKPSTMQCQLKSLGIVVSFLVMGSISVTLQSVLGGTVFVAMFAVVAFSCSQVLCFNVVFQSGVILGVKIAFTTSPTAIRLLVHQIFNSIVQIFHNL